MRGWPIGTRAHDRRPPRPGAPAHEPAPPAPVPPGAARLLALQRAAGNRATAAVLARDDAPAGTATAVARSVRLRVGVELTSELAQAAWQATLGGALDDAGLARLHAVALQHWASTIDADERLFIAALLDAGNARALHVEHPYGLFSEAEVAFDPATITAANRQRVADVGRRDVPPSRGDATAPHVEGDTSELDRQITEMAGHFAGVAATALKLADGMGIAHVAVYYAMIGGASDSTPDDRAYAGVTYVLARQAGLDVADDILRGRLKVDAVPKPYLQALNADAEGAYFSRAGALKGDTLYLPWDTNPENLGDRATIVHELKHAVTDKEKASVTNAQNEVRSFETQMGYVVGQIQPLTGAARTQAVAEAAKGGGQVEILAALGAIRDQADPPDPDAVKVVEELNAAVTDSLADLAPYLAMPILRLYDATLKAVSKRYAKHNPRGRSATDGFSGESRLD